MRAGNCKGCQPLAMSKSVDSKDRLLAVQGLAIDRLTAEIAGTLAAEGIESLVLKGPALGQWLYPGDVRSYSDSDLMVAPEEWRHAIAVLNRLGFSAMPHPRREILAGTCFIREGKSVDLHCALQGLEGDLKAVWDTLLGGSEWQSIGGAELRVPGRPALLLHVGLHANHHAGRKPPHPAEGKALEDLRRAIALATEEEWREAVKLARLHCGIRAFASGMRLLPEGAALAARLGIEEDLRLTRHEISFKRVSMAEAVDALFEPDLGLFQRLALVLDDFFPRSEFLRSWSPLARKGRFGVIACYPWRWTWLLAHAPRAMLVVWRARRAGYRRHAGHSGR